MKERPLIFTAWSIQRMLAGAKTMTRRPNPERFRTWKIGEHIWVREKFGYVWPKGCEDGMIYDGNEFGRPIRNDECNIVYYATEPDFDWWSDETDDNMCHPWKPSIYMPRKFSRILLEITELREEPLQDINLPDCWREGINYAFEFMIRDFIHLWDSIYTKKCPWESNPQVKVIGFKILQTERTK